jgi:hypothetical protein
MNRLILLLAAFALCASTGLADDWESFLNSNHLTTLWVGDDLVYWGSTGGLVVYDRSTGAEEKIVKTIGGLKSNTISAIARDEDGRIWIGTPEDGVSVLNTDGTWDYHGTQQLDLLGDQITDIVSVGEWTVVSTNGGMSLFRNGQFGIFYDGSDWANPTCSYVTEVGFDGERLLVGAACGVFEYGVAEQTWKTVLLDQGEYHIDHDGLDAFWIVNKTDSSVYTYDGTDLEPVSKTFLRGYELTDISASDSSIWLCTTGGPKWFSFERQRWERATDGLAGKLQLSVPIFVSDDGRAWLATDQGLGIFDIGDSTWSIETSMGPAGSYVQDLEIDADGAVWCATGQRGISAPDVSIGILVYDGTDWEQIVGGQASGVTVPANVYCLAANPAERSMWAGVWDVSQGNLLRYTLDTDRWASYLDILQTRVISDVYVDPQGTVVFSEYWRTGSSGVGYLNIMCGGDVITRYSNTQDPGCLETGTITAVGPGPGGGYLVGEYSEPVVALIDPGADCQDKGDDACDKWGSADGLAGGVGYAFAGDDFGVFWMGSSGGLSSYDGIWHKVLTTAGAVWDIEIDGAGNKWVATDEGIYVLKGFGTIWDDFAADIEVYDSSNSPLGGAAVKTLAFSADGALWIGTAGGGIHKFIPPKTEAMRKVWVDVFPNPYIESRHDEVKFAGFLPGSRISIYTIAGDLVAEFDGKSAWSQEQMEQQEITSGVYVYRAVALDESEFFGRLVIIR